MIRERVVPNALGKERDLAAWYSAPPAMRDRLLDKTIHLRGMRMLPVVRSRFSRFPKTSQKMFVAYAASA
jgi:hypothetical protein